MSKNSIRRFEYKKLELKDSDVSEELLEALQRYYGTDGTPYFSLIHKGVKFNQYVGVIQVGNQQIEVLPKVNKLDNEGINWRDILIHMLRMTSGIQAEATSESQLRVQPNSIFDLYIELFVKECEKLTHRGLIKRYQRRRENKRALIGRLDMTGQIKHNLVHKERFHVEYSSYDQDHLINKVLKKTLVVLSKLPTASIYSGRIKKQLLYFEDVSDFVPTQSAFNSIMYGRKNDHYKKAIQIACLILLNYHPDISHGQQHVLALMFDMNKLWERYIAMQMRRYVSDRYKVIPQDKRVFWKSMNGKKKRLNPDIILENKIEDNRIIIDTKWKLPKNMKPSDQDLRQMFAYNRLFDSQESILLYPGTNESLEGVYLTDNGGTCRVQTLQILNGDGQLVEGNQLFQPIINYRPNKSAILL